MSDDQPTLFDPAHHPDEGAVPMTIPTDFTPDLTFDLTELTMRCDAAHWFPFIEDAGCNITGPGHMDKGAFATLVNQYDEVCNGEPTSESERWSADDVSHAWIVPPSVTGDDPEAPFLITGVTAETPGAIPITTLWGAR